MNELFTFKAGSPADILARQMDFLFEQGRKIAMTQDEAKEKQAEMDEDMATDGEHEDHDCGLDESGEGSCDNDIHLAE